MAEIDRSQSTLSPNFAPYVYNMLSKGEAAANLPFQAYTGERFAGPSELQNKAFSGLGGLGTYGPGAFQGGLGMIGSTQDYMSPYMQGVVDIQKRKATEDAQRAQQGLAAKFVNPGGAGAFGGARYGIQSGMAAEALQEQLGDIQAKGLQSAYEQATKERQYATDYGLRGLADQLKAGETQRTIAQQPLEFDYQQYQESMQYPYQQAKFMQSLLPGLPLEATKYTPEQSALAAAMQGGLGLLTLMGGLKG